MLPFNPRLNGFKNEVFSESVKLMESLSFKLDSMLISCLYYNIRCTANDFYLYTTYANGNCFIYNFEAKTKNLSTAFKTGIDSGLTLELFGGVSGNNSEFDYLNRRYYLI